MRKPSYAVYKKSDLISEITEDFAGKYTKNEVKEILDNLENRVVEHLLEATKKVPVQIRLFLGLQISSWIEDGKTINTVFGKNIKVQDRFRTKAKTTRYFTRKLNTLFEEE